MRIKLSTLIWSLFLLSLGTVQAAQQGYEDIDTAELQTLLKNDGQVILIDVRTRREITTVGGSIDAPRHEIIPRGWLEFRTGEVVPDKNTPLVVYCGRNLRSPLAAQTLVDMGYTRVSNYKDGFFKWRESGLPVYVPDKARDSILYNKPQKVAEGVWSAIGATAPPTYDNSGHNNNLSFIVTDEGVVVINAGDNYLLAKALHEEIRKVTDKPVKYVVLENGQGHAMLGANYWKEQGAHIIAHVDAVEEIENHGFEILDRMRRGRMSKSIGTELALPDESFEDKRVIELGGKRIEILYLGPAHSPGDISVWLPQQKLVIAGDIAFQQRMLPVFDHTDTAGWIETWKAFEALGAEIVVPGHGDPTDMAKVTRYTRDYLQYMRDNMARIIDDGGDLQQAYKVDQSAYAHLHTFKELSRQNAGQIFRAMEFE